MIPALVVAALTLGAWAVLRRATRPLPAPAEQRFRDKRGREYGTVSDERVATMRRTGR